MVCRLSKQKNIELAILIINELRKKHYHATLDIYGEGEERDRLAALIKSYCLDECIRLMGFVESPQHLPCYYDYYLSTSLYEGFGLSIVEALAGGNLVVMTAVGELKNILKDKESAFFIGYNSQEAASKIAELIALPSEKKNVLQENGYSVYQKFFTMDRYVHDVESLYDQILEGSNV
jgi:glycosyltransferase involved in cell wall biosynthesis